MIYTQTKLRGAYVIAPEPIRDDRGYFSYLFDAREAESHGLRAGLAQVKLSFNHHKGTVRGMHFQVPPAAEVKIVRCPRGAVWDVIVDFRPDSPTYLQSFGVELSAENHLALYVPQMFAHGYQTLEDNTEVVYQVDEYYSPKDERGYRWNDPAIAVQWPLPISSISKKDESWPALQPAKR